MSQSSSPNRRVAVGGGIVLAVIVVVLGYLWLNRPAAQLKAPSDELIDKLMAAKPDQRDDMIIELGRRGPEVIPQVTAAYEKAPNDPDLRIQLVTAIYRTNAPVQAIPALERLLQKEKNTDVRSAIQNNIAGLRRSGNPAP
ncbi:MAG: hypothetical protein KA354_13320 [Phycisphaerae bacterium]|nr:hypothetical protein [Phycisphaerae bacterium]